MGTHGPPKKAHDFSWATHGPPTTFFYYPRATHGLPINKILKAHFNLFDYFRLFHFLKILLLFIIIIYSNCMSATIF